MEVGNTVIFISNSIYGKQSRLTKNKHYTITKLNRDINGDIVICIINDLGIEHNYYPYLFKLLSEHREEQINKVLNECEI